MKQSNRVNQWPSNGIQMGERPIGYDLVQKLRGLVVALFIGLGLIQSAKGQATWTGAVDSNWNNPANWSNDNLPQDIIDYPVFIPVANGPTISGASIDADTNIITINYPGTDLPDVLSITNNGSLTNIAQFVIGGGQISVSNGTLSTDQTILVGGQITIAGILSSFNSGQLSVNSTLQITNGGTVNSTNGTSIGDFGTGAATVDGIGSSWNTQSLLLVGADGGTGNLTISNGGTVTSDGSDIAGGTSSDIYSNATVSITGTNSIWNNNGDLTIGSDGFGIMSITNGALVTNVNGSIQNAGVDVSGADSLWINSGNLSISPSRSFNTVTSNLTIENGGVVSIGGSLSINGTLGTTVIYLNTGGVLKVGGVNGIIGNTTFGLNQYDPLFGFNGGTLQVTTADLTTSADATLVAGTASTINTNGMNVTWSGNLTDAGALVKSGQGTLTLLGNNSYGGGTTISQGIVVLTNGTSLGTGAVTFNGGTLQWAAGSTTDFSTLGTIFASGEAYLDTNGNNITLAKSVGSNGVGGLAKVGAGMLTLGAANTYTGATDIRAGTLALNFSSAGAPTTNLITTSSPLTLNGGTLQLIGKSGATDSQSFNGTLVSTGASSVALTQNTATSLTLNLGALTRTTGAVADFTLPTTGEISATSSSTGGVVTNAQGTAYATVAGAGWATLTSGNMAALGTYQTSTSPSAWLTTDNVSLSSSPSTVTANDTINTLRITGTGTTTTLVVQSSDTLTLKAGGILVTGTGTNTISGGSLKSGSPELVIVQNDTTHSLAISANIVDGGTATTLTKAGAGTLSLSGTNTYTGGTYLDAGVLSFATGAMGSGQINLNGGTLQWGSSNTADVSSKSVVLGVAGGTLDTNGNNVTLANAIGSGGSGNLTKIGTGTLVLHGNNADPASGYSGATILQAGTIQFASPSNFGTGGLIVNGGTLQWGAGSTADISNQSLLISSSGATFDTNGNNVELANPIGANGLGALTKIGAGTLTLTGNNTYQGTTTVNAGTLQLGDGNINASVASASIVANANLGLTANLAGVTFSQVISGTGNLIVNGPGTVVLNQTETFTGNTTISSGTLQLGSGPSGSNVNGLISGNIIDNANLTLNSFVTLPGLISGTGNLTIAPGFSMTITTNESYTGTTTIGESATLQLGNATKNAILSGNIAATSLGNAGLIITGNSTNETYSGILSGFIQLTVNGTGNLTLTGANTFGSPTIISGTSRRLLLGNPLALQDSALNITSGNLGFVTITNATLGGLSGNQNIALTNTTGGAVALTLGENNPNLSTTYSAVLSDGGLGASLTKIGTSNLILTGNNTYTGGTFIDGGNLTFSSLGNLGTGGLTMNGGTLVWATGTTTDISTRIVTIGSSGGTLQINSGNVTLADPIGGFGTGDLTKSGAGTLILQGKNTYTGNTTMANGQLLLGNSLALQNSTLVYNNVPGGHPTLSFGNLTSATLGDLSGNTFNTITLTNNAATGVALTVGGNNQSTSFEGTLAGLGSLTKIGNGTLTLDGQNTYSGNTLISTGTLGGGGEIGSNNATVNGTLQSGSVSIARSFTFGGNLTLTSNATLDIVVVGFPRPLDVVGNLTLNGTLAINPVSNYLPALGNVLDLFQAGSISGAFANMELPALSKDLTWDTSLLYSTGDISVYASNYANWAGANGLTGPDALPAAKPFGGGPANVLRYAMNLDTTPMPYAAPTMNLINNNGTNFITLQYQARKDLTDYQLVPQSSPDLVNWTMVDAGNITQLTDVDAYTAQYQAAVAVPAGGTVFLRVAAQVVP